MYVCPLKYVCVFVHLSVEVLLQACPLECVCMFASWSILVCGPLKHLTMYARFSTVVWLFVEAFTCFHLKCDCPLTYFLYVRQLMYCCTHVH